MTHPEHIQDADVDVILKHLMIEESETGFFDKLPSPYQIWPLLHQILKSEIQSHGSSVRIMINLSLLPCYFLIDMNWTITRSTRGYINQDQVLFEIKDTLQLNLHQHASFVLIAIDHAEAHLLPSTIPTNATDLLQYEFVKVKSTEFIERIPERKERLIALFKKSIILQTEEEEEPCDSEELLGEIKDESKVIEVRPIDFKTFSKGIQSGVEIGTTLGDIKNEESNVLDNIKNIPKPVELDKKDDENLGPQKEPTLMPKRTDKGSHIWYPIAFLILLILIVLAVTFIILVVFYRRQSATKSQTATGSAK